MTLAAMAGIGQTQTPPANTGVTPPAAPGGDPSPPAGGQVPGATAPASPPGAPYRPEGLPDHFAGTSDQETIDKLWKTADGFRRSQAEFGSVPDKPDGYSFTPSEKVAPLIGDLKDDGFMAKVQARAHSSKIPTGQFNAFLNGVMEDLIETGNVATVDYAKELADLVPDNAKGLDEPARKAAASQRIGANLAFIEGAKAQMIAGGTPKEQADEIATTLLTRLGDDAKGNRAIEWLRGQSRETKPAMGGRAPGGVTDADLDARTTDDRNDPQSSKFDKGFAEETRRMFKERFPS